MLRNLRLRTIRVRSARSFVTAPASGVQQPVSASVRAFSSGVQDRVYEGTGLSQLRAPLPPTFKFDPAAYKTVPTVVSTLGNGMRVASESSLGETATVALVIDAGSRCETSATSGVAHFLEHLCFKGTQRRSQEQLESEIENLGAHLNAYTSREQIVYYARVLKKDVPKAVDILSDILLNSVISKEAVERERWVIQREAEEVAKQDDEVLFDMLHETAYNRSALGRTILGPSENIAKITRDDLINYVKANFVAPRFTLVGAGAVDHKQLVELGEKHFSQMASSGEGPLANLPKDKSIFIGSDIRYRDDSQPLCQVALAFEGVGANHGDSFVQMVMQTLLGNWNKHHYAAHNMHSPMCSQLAENHYAESVSSFNLQYSDTSLLGVMGVCEPEQVSDMCWVILREMVNLAHRTSDEDVLLAHTILKSNFLASLNGSPQIAEDIGRQLQTYGRRLSIAETFARIDAVDAATVRRVASELIEDRDLAVAARGPLFKMPDYGWLRRRTFMLRY